MMCQADRRREFEVLQETAATLEARFETFLFRYDSDASSRRSVTVRGK